MFSLHLTNSITTPADALCTVAGWCLSACHYECAVRPQLFSIQSQQTSMKFPTGIIPFHCQFVLTVCLGRICSMIPYIGRSAGITLSFLLRSCFSKIAFTLGCNHQMHNGQQAIWKTSTTYTQNPGSGLNS